MATRAADDFLAGVIEGFYGPPWTPSERLELFGWMSRWGLNTYLYAPKDDLNHRAIWRELYSKSEAAEVRDAIQGCREHGLNFIYGIGPGLDIRYSMESDIDRLKGRFSQLLSLGCEHFALLFDDIPERMDPDDTRRWGSLAAAQCQVANSVHRWLRERSAASRTFFCPTPYCSRMAFRRLGGDGYLATVGRELLPEIDVFWTGPEIISREITVEHVAELEGILRRRPVIWDNLHANDYDGRRFFCGPYAGRPPELRAKVRGLLCNPNTEFPLNFVPLHTLGAFIRCDAAWNPRAAYLTAMQEWFPAFATVGPGYALQDLIQLGDCYYLPHEEGPEAAALHGVTQQLLQTDPNAWGAELEEFRLRAGRLREFCTHLVGLRSRPLFCALSRRIWELREELDLIERFVAFRSAPSSTGLPFSSDFHQPGTYRGGMVARLQRLLVQEPDGTFTAAPATS